MTTPPTASMPAPLSGTAAQPAHVELAGVTKQFSNGARVLDQIGLRVAKGDFVSLIGPSGCGKSTLLKLVSGLSAPTAGQVRVDGMTPVNARETMSFIFQDATLLPWRTVAGNVQLGLELEGVAAPKRDRAVRELLALVGLENVGGRFPRQLSGGMRMRVSIARALATSPRLLLMDEPFGALDEMTRDRLNEELLRLREREGWTVLFVTHSVSEAVFLSNRVIVLGANPGRVVRDLVIPFPYPRDDALRGSDAFAETVVDVSRALRAAERMHVPGMNTETADAIPTVGPAPAGDAVGRGRWLDPLAGVSVFVFFLLVWRLAIWAFSIPSYLLPTPWQVALSMVRDHAKLFTALGITGVEAGGGLLGSAVIGVLGAIVFAEWRWVRRLLYPYTLLLQTVPILAVAPLILTWFGSGQRQVMLIATIICVFPILANATQGMISVERNLLDLFAMHNATRAQLLWRLRLPHALPSLFTGLRIASGLSVIGAITGELFAGSNQVGVGGLGYSITYANSQMQTDYMFALSLMSSILGFTFFFAVMFLEWFFLHHWHESATRPGNE